MRPRAEYLAALLAACIVALSVLLAGPAAAAVDPNATDPDNAPFTEIVRTTPPGIIQWNVPGTGTSDTYNVVGCWEYIGGPYETDDLCWVEGVFAAGATLPLGYPENEGPFCEAAVCWTERQSYWASRVGGPVPPDPPASAASGPATEATMQEARVALVAIFWAICSSLGFVGYSIGARDA